MASATTPIVTYAGHASIFELRIRCTQQTVPYVNHLHVAIERDGSWDNGQPSPTFWEVIDGLWNSWDGPWMQVHDRDRYKLTELWLGEVLDYDSSSGQPVPIYGDFHSLVDFTGLSGRVEGAQVDLTDHMPSYVAIYCLKQKDASPRNINGSLRLGPVAEEWTEDSDANRINAATKLVFQGQVDNLLVPVAVTAADGGNIANCTMVIMQKTPAAGMAAPWDFVAIPDRIKVRFGLGTQNTRKKTRNTYT